MVPTRNLMVQFMVRYFHRYQNENPRTIRSLENNLNVESIIFSSVFFHLQCTQSLCISSRTSVSATVCAEALWLLEYFPADTAFEKLDSIYVYGLRKYRPWTNI